MDQLRKTISVLFTPICAMQYLPGAVPNATSLDRLFKLNNQGHKVIVETASCLLRSNRHNVFNNFFDSVCERKTAI